MHRRTLLATVGSGALSLAGCLSRADPAGTERMPEGCPTTQGLDVDRPAELDASTVASFVEAYERVYYRDVVVEYEPESRLDSYALGGSVDGPPEEAGDGWKLSYSGSGGVYRPTLFVEATTASRPEGADLVPVDELDDARLTRTLAAAAETGEARLDVENDELDRYDALFASASDDFERLSGRADGDTLYVDVDGRTVELSVRASNLHGDYWWSARYYVDEHVVRRTAEEDVDPRNGELLECRPPD